MDLSRVNRLRTSDKNFLKRKIPTDGNGFAVVLSAPGNQFLWVDKRLAKLLNIEPKMMIGKHISDYDLPLVFNLLTMECLEKENTTGLYPGWEADSVIRIDRIPLYTKENTVYGMLFFGVDVGTIKDIDVYDTYLNEIRYRSVSTEITTLINEMKG